MTLELFKYFLVRDIFKKMTKFLVHTQVVLEYLKVVEVENYDQVLILEQVLSTEGFQKQNPEEIVTVTEVTDEYNLPEDANSKGFE